MLWYPMTSTIIGNLSRHIDDHKYVADVVRAECDALNDAARGIVALEVRVAGPPTATHHQKMIVIRVGTVNVAYCGGVDLAFTRRDAPDATHAFTFAWPSKND